MRLPALAFNPMRMRLGILGLLVCLGCHSTPPQIALVEGLTPSAPAVAPAVLGGLEPVRERAPAKFVPLVQTPRTEAVQAAFQAYGFKPVPASDANPSSSSDMLTLAMDSLNQGKEEKACSYLRQYVEAHPDRKQARAFYAEVLLKLDRVQDARHQFEEIIANSLDSSKPDLQHLVQCHGRLVEVAERTESEFDEYLHRGLAMFWLAKQRQELGELVENLPLEVMLVKAAAQLQVAHSYNRRDARTCVYLHSIWKQLGQRAQADRWLNRARETTLFTSLHPAEQHVLELAYRAQTDQSWLRR